MTSKSEMKRLACQLGSYRQLGDTVIVHPLSDEERKVYELAQRIIPFSDEAISVIPVCECGEDFRLCKYEATGLIYRCFRCQKSRVLKEPDCPHCSSDNISYLTSGSGTRVNYCKDCTGGTW